MQDTTKAEATINAAEEEVSSQASETRPQVLWSLYFNSVDSTRCTVTEDAPKNIYVCGGPDVELDFEFAVNQVSRIPLKNLS